MNIQIVLYFLLFFIVSKCVTNAVPTSISCEHCLQKCAHLLQVKGPANAFLQDIPSKSRIYKRSKRQSDFAQFPEGKADDKDDRFIWAKQPIFAKPQAADIGKTDYYGDYHDESDYLDIICQYKDTGGSDDFEIKEAKQIQVPEFEFDRVVWDSKPIKKDEPIWRIMDFKHEDGEHNFPPTIYEETYDGPEDDTASSKTTMRFHMAADEREVHTNGTYEYKNETESDLKNDQTEQNNKTRRHNILLDSNDCGVSRTEPLGSGNNATIGQFPWIVRIAYRNKTTNRISYRCSGSVISYNAILTAAHCVKNLVQDLEVAFVLTGDDVASSKRFQINEILAHPEYDVPKYAHDIALLLLESNESLPKICLPSHKRELGNNSGIFAGWYANITDTVNDEDDKLAFVQFIKLAIVNNSACSEAYTKYSENAKDPIVIIPEQLCAISKETLEVCHGDSGGPLMDDGTYGIYYSDRRYTLLGMVAFGLFQPGAKNGMCGALDFPSVYTRVSAYRNWIQSELQRYTRVNSSF